MFVHCIEPTNSGLLRIKTDYCSYYYYYHLSLGTINRSKRASVSFTPVIGFRTGYDTAFVAAVADAVRISCEESIK